MLNLSKIQLELERAKEKLRNVEEVIQKIEGKTFPNGPIRYGGLKVELHSDKNRNPVTIEENKNQRRRVIASAVDSRVQRLASDDASFNLKRGAREKRESGIGLKRQIGDGRPQGVFARLSGVHYQQAEEEDEDDFVKKPTLPSRVITTASEAPSRQEVIAAQSVDEQSKQRNRRMFGALVGTLQKFRKEETRVREREEKRLKVEKKLEEDAKREKEKLMQEKRELFMEKKRREVEIKRIEWSLNRVKEYEAWEANVIPLKNFIQTQAKPHIFYLPSMHNTKTEERLTHSQKLVERMIEKRKNNLKEEIENSEKKARKTAAEGVEEEEAENIPEENEASNAEQQMEVDFETENKENGFFEKGAKDESECTKDVDEMQETGKVEENWDEIHDAEAKESVEGAENANETGSNKHESKEGSPIPDSTVADTKFNSDSKERRNEGEGDDETQLGKNDDFSEKVGSEERTCEGEESKNSEVETDGLNTELRDGESSEAKVKPEVTVEESESIETLKENEPELENEKQDSSVVETNEKTVIVNTIVQNTDKKESVSENEPKPEDGIKKKSEGDEKKSKTTESSRRREKSRSRKPSRRSRSPKRKSRSPRTRRRSSSRRKRSLRKRSRSSSPPRKSRKSRSPPSKRGRRNRSPHTKPNRRSSSRSSSSVSPRKRRSESSSSGSSKSS